MIQCGACLRPRPALLIAWAALTGFWTVAALAGEADPLFQDHTPLEVTLSGPLNALARDRDPEPERRPGTLTVLGGSDPAATFAVELEPRGKSRRDRSVCTFPPLWVQFDKEQVKGTLFKKQDKLKLVTYCRSPKSFQDFVILEYLAYRIFNELSPAASFRVRLLNISYEGSDGRGKPLTRYGFFIEHKKRLAKRLDTKVMEPTEQIPTSTLDPEQASIAELFQFMVSNTDFSLIGPPENDVCCHNTVLFDAGNGMYLPVPYDFDRTGLVNPPNGLPAAELGQRNFRDRIYRGFCRDDAVMNAALEKTRAARGIIEALINDQPQLSDRSKKSALKFIDSYYTIIDDDKRRAREVKCRDVS
ncbi:MAG: hypothetical protein P8Y69_16185 [Gammaproteobacteria bacterium]|jgi:hypothetical protein